MTSTAKRQPVPRETLNIRIRAEERGLIDRAAKARGTNRTDSSSTPPPGRGGHPARPGADSQLGGVCRVSRPPRRAREAERTATPHDADAGPLENWLMLSAPVPLAPKHRLDRFSCGEPPLDDWLKGRAGANQISGASRTFVACESGVVVAYYALASSAISGVMARGRFRRDMPDPVPVAVLARLAVTQSTTGEGSGARSFRTPPAASSTPPTRSASAV